MSKKGPGIAFPKMRVHRSLVEQVVERLQQMIIDGSLPAGRRLVENDLCTKMGVSRSPMREAFRTLEYQGYVTRAPRKGITVAPFTLREAEEIYLIRAHLESLATGLAVSKRNPKVLDALRTLQGRIVQAVRENNSRTYFQLNSKFHEIIVNASENGRLIALIDNFSRQTSRYRREILAVPGKMEATLRNHEELLLAFEAGDGPAAERLRRAAILSNLRILCDHMVAEKPGDPQAR